MRIKKKQLLLIALLIIVFLIFLKIIGHSFLPPRKYNISFMKLGTVVSLVCYSDKSIDFSDLASLASGQSTDPNEIRNTHINIGTGVDLTIKNLAETIREVIGYKGTISWDSTKPDGTPRKLMDVSRLAKLGWKANIPLEKGLQMVYEQYKKA